MPEIAQLLTRHQHPDPARLARVWANSIASKTESGSVELQAGVQFDDKALAQALRYRADAIKGLKSPAFDDKQLYLEVLQATVTVKDGRAIIRCALPLDPIEVDLECEIDFRTIYAII